MHRVRAEVARRQGDGPASEHTKPDHFDRASLPRWCSGVPPLPAKKEFALAELMAFSDAEFVDSAYRALLRRPPDTDGAAEFLRALRTGELTKVEVLAALRWSAEGRAESVHVDGLRVRYLIRRARRLRIVGPVIAWVLTILRLPALQRRLELIDVVRAREAHELGHQFNAVAEGIEARWSIEDRLVEVSARLGEQNRSIEHTLAQQAEQIDELQRERSSLEARLQEMRDRFGEEITAMAVRLAAAAEEANASMQGRIDALAEQLQLLQQDRRAQRNELEALVTTVSGKVGDQDFVLLSRQVTMQRFASVELQRRLGMLLDEVRRRLPSPLKADQLQQFAAEDAHRLDEMYAELEMRFRGSHESVKQRAEHYLAAILEAGVGTVEAPVLDLGCGRGEWLDLLAERGLAARGVDLNRVFLAACRERGLDVVESDVLAYLRELPDASIGAITSLHVVEHLPLNAFIELLDASHRVLMPGGLIALETPNPENLLVATHFFYLDPTHRNPLPPALLQWMVQARGFTDVRVEYLTEHRATASIEPVPDDVPGAHQINHLVSLVNQALDYTVVAQKRADGVA
jgi:2-polyprenyl-3-methyl-5-hydroxy-6-metoxy-1,4-benzoquinol methylase